MSWDADASILCDGPGVEARPRRCRVRIIGEPGQGRAWMNALARQMGWQVGDWGQWVDGMHVCPTCRVAEAGIDHGEEE